MPNKLDKKRETLLVCAAVSIEAAPEDVTDLERLEITAAYRFYLKAQEWIQATLERTVELCSQSLLTIDWTSLAQDRDGFNREMDRVLCGARTCLRILHDIGQGRPPENLERDLAIYEIWWSSKQAQDDKRLSDGQVAIAYNKDHSPEGHIDRRMAERVRKRFGDQNAYLFSHILALPHVQKLALSQGVRPDFSEPEIVLDFLTTNGPCELSKRVERFKDIFDQRVVQLQELQTEPIKFAPVQRFAEIERDENDGDPI